MEYEDYAVKLREGDIFMPYIPAQDALFTSIEHFVECIEVNKPSISDPKQAIRMLKILEQAELVMNT